MGLLCRLIGQNPLGCGEDRDSQPTHGRGNLIGFHINPSSRLAHPPDMDESLSVCIVFKSNSNQLMFTFILHDFEIGNEPFRF